MLGEMLPVTTPEEAETYRRSGLWCGETIYSRFRRVAQANPNKVAVKMDDTRLSFSELHDKVLRAASGFLRAGIKKGQIVAVDAPNSIEQPLLHIALNAIGAVYMPLHHAFQETEIVHLIAKSAAVAAIIVDDKKGEKAPIYREKCPGLRHVWVVGQNYSELADGPILEPLLPAGEAPTPDDIGHIMLSSGTTALPKISVFTNNNVFALMDAFGDMIHLSSADVSAGLAPAGTGATGYVFGVLPVILVGGTAIILGKWDDPADAVRLIIENKCTYATAIPTQISVMLPAIEAAGKGAFEHFRVFNNAGAPLAQQVATEVEEVMQCRVQAIYGASDGGAPCMISIDDPAAKRTSTVGRILPGRKVEFRNALGQAVEKGEVGEICWKSPDKSFGYLNDMAASAGAFDEAGFYRSGDLARMDMEGYVSIVGRVKDMILRGGQNISPRLIEDLLITHPAVLEVAVAAMPDPKLGERACAFVVPKAGQSFSLKDAVEFLTEKKIVKWQFPERIEVMDHLPRSAGDKIAKNKLTEYVTAKLAQQSGG